MSTALIEILDISLEYSGKNVLDRINLAVRAGELVSILGPSGSGKSTLLRIVAGLLKPTSGQMRIKGEIVSGPRPDVALAFQDACLLPWLNVEQNVGFGLGFARQEKLPRAIRRERVIAALNEVSLLQTGRYMPSQLSGGMAQRAALARCLAREPGTLLLDEPFGALDEVTRADMQKLLVKVVRDTGAATVIVTHDIDEALLVSDRVILLGTSGTLIEQWVLDIPEPRDAHIEALGRLRIEILQALQTSMAHAA
ncbi:ABC transporter ATP-binding protein [Paraburkholderia sp. BCC1884]|uniref:ABC transporter ATP-binding protein n=1 Tax=Paraburkholderia sp. BCC1884 TaxID=2562668 RepID=UPI0011844723|nr:ABC transporter ATP-binding protein [Paraburkholderia sp. BCC1884]